MKEDNNISPVVFGWENLESAAEEVYCTVNSRLLKGIPLFLYKSISGSSNYKQIVVVRNIDSNKQFTGDYGVGVITSTWSSLYPRVPYSYLKTIFWDDIKTSKIEKLVINKYNDLISNLENKNEK